MTRLDVINMALGKCGLPWAASMADTNWGARNLFDQVAEECIRMHSWNFAITYKALTMASSRPPHGYALAYTLPADCVRLLDIRTHQDIRAPLASFSVVLARGIVYTNASPANARYVRKAINPETDNWPADFTDAMATALAAEIAPLAAQSFGLGGALKQQAQSLIQLAIANDADEEQRRVPLEPHILFSR